MAGRFSETIKAQVRTDVELLNLPAAEIARKYQLSRVTVERWIMRYGWKRGSLVKQAQEAVVERNLRIFEEAGCTPTTVAKVIASNIVDQNVRIDEIKAGLKNLIIAAQLDGDGDGDGDGKALSKLRDEIVSMIHRYAASKSAALGYIQEYNRMVGSLAPVRRELTGKDGGPLQFSVALRAMSSEELERMAEKFFRKYVMLQGLTPV